MKYISAIAAWIIATQFIFFGLNKLFLFFTPPPPAGAQAQVFMMGMFGSYLASLVAFIEIIGSLLLVIPRTKFIGLLLLIPVMLNIVFYHFAHDLPGNTIWIWVSLLFLIVCYNQKINFRKLLAI